MNSRRRTHCLKGHELSNTNVIEAIDKAGHLLHNCKICFVYRQNNPKEFHLREKHRTHCKRGHELTSDNTYEYLSKQNHLIKECKLCAKDKYNRRFLQLRDNHLKRKFGIGIKEYEEMLAAQDGKCAGCGAIEPGGHGMKNGRNNFHVDHDHITGKIRKLLCMKCNSILGYANDSTETLKALIEYLEQFSQP